MHQYCWFASSQNSTSINSFPFLGIFGHDSKVDIWDLLNVLTHFNVPRLLPMSATAKTAFPPIESTLKPDIKSSKIFILLNFSLNESKFPIKVTRFCKLLTKVAVSCLSLSTASR